MKTIYLSLFLFFSLSVAAQKGSQPDWANKAGSFGVGINTTLGVSNYLQPDNDERNLNRYSSIGIRFIYNPVSFANLAVSLGQSNEHWVREYELGNEDFEEGYDFKGFTVNTRLAFNLFGTNGALTPNCTGGLVASPFIGLTFISGEDAYYRDGPGTILDDEYSPEFTKSVISLGTRVEYFMPKIAGLKSSVFYNFNIYSIHRTNYEEDFKSWNTEGNYLFNSSSSFGNCGFTIWFN